MKLDLSPRQEQTVAAAVTTLAALVLLVAVGLLGWLIATFLQAFSTVLLPLAVGAVSALVFRPAYDWLQQTARLPRSLALLVVILALLLPVVAFLWFVGTVLVAQLVDLAQRAPELWNEARIWIEERIPQLAALLDRSGASDSIREALAQQQETILEGLQTIGTRALSAGRGVGEGLLAFVGATLSWAVMPIYFAFFLTVRGIDFDSSKFLPFLKSGTREDVVYLVREFVNILVAFFRGQMLIAFLQGLLFGIGFAVVGLRYGFVIGMALGLLNVIPYLGSMIGLAVALPLSLLQPDGGWLLLLLVIGVFAVVQQIEGYFLTPKIMGDRTGLHFMTIIVAIFFWGTALDGILGMILAIPLTAFLASLWRLAREKYIAELF